MRELSLYFHIPYCKSKCHYCDFNSYADKKHTVTEYFECLNNEIKLHKNLKGSKVRTIFIGGGSPSVVRGDYVVKIINSCKNHFKFNSNIEISVEANPESLTKQKLIKYKNAGVNRLSIGLQAWQNHLLKDIGRIHTKEQFINAYKIARKVGFTNINIDLIFGLPNQTMEEWIETIKSVIELQPNHLSCYSLKVEEGTKLFEQCEKGAINLPDEDTEREMYYTAKEMLEKAGYIQYEISNFAKPKYQSVHNSAYWTYREYIGFGAGAHSFFNLERAENECSIEKYMSRINNGKFAYDSKQAIDKEEQMSEFIITRLRMSEGINKSEFYKRFHTKIEDIHRNIIDRFVNEGLLEENRRYIKLTDRGLDFGNVVMREFI